MLFSEDMDLSDSDRIQYLTSVSPLVAWQRGVTWPVRGV